MALFKSQVLTQASGSVGGVTYTRAKGGLVMRARAVPTDPSTARQAGPRAALTAAVNAWITNQTAAQRAAWELYAQNVPTTNRLGDQITLSGQNMFVRSWSIYEQVVVQRSNAGTAPNVAPSIFSLGSFTTPTFVADASSGITLTLNASDEWGDEDEAYMLVFQGRTCPPTRNYFRGPWRLLGVVPGANGAAPSTANFNNAAIAANGYPFVAGQCVNLSVGVYRADFRYSTRRKLTPMIAVP